MRKITEAFGGNQADFKLEKGTHFGPEIIRPAGVDLFFCGTEKAVLPNEVLINQRLLEQASRRRGVYQDLKELFRQADGLGVDDAIEEGLVRPEKLGKIYQDLANFLETDENNGRIILYLPSELLSDFSSSKLLSEDLSTEWGKFKSAYRGTWLRLLHERDVRASFVDGDVLEPGLGIPARTRKAGHLVPLVLQKGLFSAPEVMEQLEVSSDEELLQSLTEGLSVAFDWKLISQEDWQQVEAISKRKPVVARVLKMSSHLESSGGISPKKENLPQGEYLGNIVSQLEVDLAMIEVRYQPGSAEVARITPERVRWKRQTERERVIDGFARKLAQELKEGSLGLKEVELLCQRSEFANGLILAGIESFIVAGEELSVSNVTKAKEFSQSYQPLVKKLWQADSFDIKDSLISGLIRWQRKGIIEEEFLKELGICVPDLSSSLPVNPESLLATDLQPLAEAVKKIKEHPVLSKFFYPQALVFGSRLKGYATLAADLDLAVFVKPETPWEKREEIIKLLRQEVPEFRGIDRILEFWLEKENGQFNFRHVPEKARGVINPSQVHFVLGGVWLGQGEELRQIYGDILKRYLDLSRFGEEKEELRFHLLRQIEMDSVQFRLLHKGYRHFYPERKDTAYQKASLIDGESDYWDSGFREVATLLFLSRVFLPDLQLS